MLLPIHSPRVISLPPTLLCERVFVTGPSARSFVKLLSHCAPLALSAVHSLNIEFSSTVVYYELIVRECYLRVLLVI